MQQHCLGTGTQRGALRDQEVGSRQVSGALGQRPRGWTVCRAIPRGHPPSPDLTLRHSLASALTIHMSSWLFQCCEGRGHVCTGQVGAPGKGERDISKEKTDAQGGEVTVVQSHREGPGPGLRAGRFSFSKCGAIMSILGLQTSSRRSAGELMQDFPYRNGNASLARA